MGLPKQILYVETIGYLNPNSITDRRMAQMRCLKAEKDEIVIQIHDKVHSTNYPEDYQIVPRAMLQILDKVFKGPNGESVWSGYLHDYKFANGRVYDRNDTSIDGHNLNQC